MQSLDTAEDKFSEVKVGLLEVLTEDKPPVLKSIAIVLEGQLAMKDIATYPEAFCLLFGLSYALNLEYPKGMNKTFDFVQKVCLGLGGEKLGSKLQTLKNALLRRV